MDENKTPTYKLNVSPHLKERYTLSLSGSWPTAAINFLVKECQVSRPTAGKLLKGEGTQIRFATLRKLSDVLNVPVQDLFVPVN